MATTVRLVFCAFLTTLPLIGGILKAADSAPMMDSMLFSGRWDLRSHDHAITVNSGSYFRARFSGTSIGAKFDLSLNKTPLPTITWRIDDGDWQESEIAPEVKLADGLPNATHAVWLMVRGIDEHQNRWTSPLVGSITFLGLDLSEGGKILSPLEPWIKPQLKIEFLGDSITEGVLVQAGGCGPGKTSWPWQTDALHSYACQTAMLLNADWRQVGFGATGLSHGGSGGAKPALESFNYFYQDCPRDDWQPDLVVINQGTNDAGMPPEKYGPLYTKYLTLVRQAYPKAKIAALRPFGGFQAASITQDVHEARTQGDSAIYYIDTTGWYSGTLHPNAASSIGLAQKLAAVLKSEVLSP